MQPSILIVIVLYKQKLADAISFCSIKNQNWVQDAIFVYDNSTEIDIHATEYPIHYVHDSNNGGLGKAYNCAAQYAAQNGYDWLLLLDQDTTFDTTFLAAYHAAIAVQKDIYLFAPIVQLSTGDRLSPSRMWKNITTLPALNTYPLTRYVIINSGLCVNVAVFLKAGGYDEDIWLDFSDLQFTRKLLRYIKRFYVVPTIAIQNFSNQESDVEKLKARFQIYLQCAKHCHYYDLEDYLLRQWNVYKHTLALSLRTKNIIFLKWLITDYIL